MKIYFLIFDKNDEYCLYILIIYINLLLFIVFNQKRYYFIISPDIIKIPYEEEYNKII